MTYANHQILSLVSHMTDMSEDLISESDIRAGASLPQKTKQRGRFATFMNHPAMVAVLCAVVSISVLVAVVMAGRGGPDVPPVGTPPVEEIVTQEPTDSELIPADFASYESIIRMYRKLVEVLPDYYTSGGGENPEVDGLFVFPNEQAREWYDRVGSSAFLLCPGDRKNATALFGYAIKDVNGDGVDELFLLTKDFQIVTLFTQHNGKPVLLEDFWNRKKGYVNENGQIMIGGSNGVAADSQEIYRFETATGQLVLEEALGYDGLTEDLKVICYHQVGEEKTYISEEEFNAIKNQEPYVGFGTEKNRQVLGAEYTPVSMPSEVSTYYFVGSSGLKAEHIKIYTDPEKICAFSDFFTDVFVRSDPPEVPKQPLIGATCWVTLTYENGTTQTYGDWGAYIEYENKWYQLEAESCTVIDDLFKRYDSDVELSEVNIRPLAKDDVGFCGVMEDTEQYVYVKGFSGTWFEIEDTVRIVYATEKIKESEGAVVGSEGETVAYQWIIEDPLSGWVIWRSE